MADQEIVQIVHNEREGGERWNPVVGEAANGVVARNVGLPEDEAGRVLQESHEILARCLPPDAENRQLTGLVIGYVQSGKTLSFTSLAAMARDNDYRLIIVIAGTTNNLVNQSVDRLRADLDLEGDNARAWRLIVNPRPEGQDLERLHQALNNWRRDDVRHELRRTALIVVMKQHQHLRNLRNLLERTDCTGFSALIIDDEGDQAGLNSKVQQQAESTTYQRLGELRDALPAHTYVLYTATPQAPLLISRIDMLSPDFGWLISPGHGYVGGQDYFGADSRYVELVPAAEIFGNDPPVEPPASLIRAMRMFIIGVAAGFLRDATRTGNRSMMIHPSQLVAIHLAYMRWVRGIMAAWGMLLDEEVGDLERAALIEEFRRDHENLSQTDGELPAFDEIEGELPTAIRETLTSEMNRRNGTRSNPPNWKDNYSHILVGGIALERGFTVEGLTVTYMPRRPGGGQADTIQQRGRFFGYKQGFLGLCRIFLENGTQRAFESYVYHEEQMRASLRHYLEGGNSLKDWRRVFFLDPELRLTRQSVLSVDCLRARSRGGWIYPNYPHIAASLVEENRNVIDAFIRGVPDQPYSRDESWTQVQVVPRHEPNASLDEVYRGLLTQIKYGEEGDSLNFTVLLVQMERIMQENQAARCSVYVMNLPGQAYRTAAQGDESDPGQVLALFQGANPRTNYPGAEAIRAPNQLTIQIHRYEIRMGRGRVLEDVPIVAVHVPENLRQGVIIQPDGRAG